MTTNAGIISGRFFRFLRTVPTAVNDYVEICKNTAQTNGSYMVRINVVVDFSTTYSIAKQYLIAVSYNATGAVYLKAPSIRKQSTGTDDFQIEVQMNAGGLILRLVKTAGTTAGGIATIDIESRNNSADGRIGFDSDARGFAELTGTGTTTAALTVYPGAVISENIYGSIYMDDSTVDVTFSSGVFLEIASGFTAGQLSGVTLDTTHALRPQTDGKYKINYNVSIQFNATNKATQAGIMVNDAISAQGKSWIYAAQGAANRPVNHSGFAILNLAVNDEISIGLRNRTDNTTLTAVNANLTLERLGL